MAAGGPLVFPLYPAEAELLRAIHAAFGGGGEGDGDAEAEDGMRLSALGAKLRYALGRKRMRVMLQPHTGLRNLCCSLGVLDGPTEGEEGEGGEEEEEGEEGEGEDGENPSPPSPSPRSASASGSPTASAAAPGAAGPRRHGGADVLVRRAAVAAAVARLRPQEERLGEGDALLLAAMRCALAAAEMPALDISALAAGMSAVLSQERYRALLGMGRHARLRTMCLRLGLVDRQGNVAADRVDALVARCEDAQRALDSILGAAGNRSGSAGAGGGRPAATTANATAAATTAAATTAAAGPTSAQSDAVERARQALAPKEQDRPKRAAAHILSWRDEREIAAAVASAAEGSAAVAAEDEAQLRPLVGPAWPESVAQAAAWLAKEGPWAQRAHLELLLAMQRVLMEEAQVRGRGGLGCLHRWRRLSLLLGRTATVLLLLRGRLSPAL